jgi:hypothetical protein
MVPFAKDMTISLSKLLEFVFPKREKYLIQRNLFYLRLYTDLIRAEEKMNPRGCKRMENILRVVRNMARNPDFKEEEAYLKRIRSIASDILSNLNRIKIKIKKDPTSDAYHAKTKLQLAQNICILRILKRSS